MEPKSHRQVTAVAILLLASATAAWGATLTPTTTADEFDALVANGECSLREAVESANLNADFGGCMGDGAYGDDVIVLAAATYVLDLGPPEDPFSLDNSVGDLDVVPVDVESLDVVGAGSEATTVERSDAANDFRIFDTDVPALLRLVDLTVRNGVSESGGAILSFGFSLVLERVVVRDNVARGFAAGGGGIVALTEVVSLTDTLVTANRAEASEDTPACSAEEAFAGGGGIFLVGFPVLPAIPLRTGSGVAAAAEIPQSGLLLLERTTIADNVATSASPDCPAVGGGGVLVDPSALVPADAFTSRLVNSTVSGNSADVGGGLVVISDPIGGGGDPTAGAAAPLVAPGTWAAKPSRRGFRSARRERTGSGAPARGKGEER